MITLQSAVARAGFVFFALWLYRVNGNAHVLGAKNMHFTPWWAIVSYLIPIVNLYEPYQGMQELWKTNSSARDWQTVPGSPLVVLWWALFLLSEFVAQFAYVFGQGSEDLDVDMESIAWVAGWNAINIPYAIVAVLLLRGIYRLQLNQASGAA